MMKKNASPAISGPEDIITAASGYQRSRLILTGFELNVWSAIGGESLSGEDVAARIGADTRGTERLCNALCAIGLMEKRNGRYSNTPLSSRYLVKDSEEYLSRIGHMLNLYRTWGTLTEAVRKGTSVTAREYDEFSLAHFIEAMHHRAKKTADELVSHIDLQGVGRILDVGGGSGVYSMAFVRRKLDIRAVVFDLPEVIPLTRRYIGESGLGERIDVMKGDYNRDDFGSGYDLVFLSAIIHINSPEGNRRLIRRAFESLNPGGRIVIQDHIIEEDRTSPPRGVIFAINMLVNTPGGDSYTESEMREWLLDSGCGRVERIATGMENDLMVGWRG